MFRIDWCRAFNLPPRKKNSSASVQNRTQIAGLVGGRSSFELAGPGNQLIYVKYKVVQNEVNLISAMYKYVPIVLVPKHFKTLQLVEK